MRDILSSKEHLDNVHCKKILGKITLFINGINDKIDIDSDVFYYINNLIKQLENKNEKMFLLNIIKPKNETEYFEYCFAINNSKIDTKNENAIEIKKRQCLFEPVFTKFNTLRLRDKETREFEIKIQDDINSFINNEVNEIKIEENDYLKLIYIVNSTKISVEHKQQLYNIIIKK